MPGGAGLKTPVQRSRILLAAVVLTGAVLRFVPLSEQSFSHDEAVTVGRVLQPDLGDTLATVPESERTPHLYYLLAWIWTRAAGEGEFGVRSLSALFGTLMIPVAYFIGRSVGRARTGLVAAALVAVNPFLIYYSGDARAYALMALFSALSVLGFARALGRARAVKSLLLWAFASALAVATHYFAAFLVVAELVLLLALAPRRREVLAAACVPALAGAALVPLAIEQSQVGGPLSEGATLRLLPTAVMQYLLGERLAITGVYTITVPVGYLALALLAWLAAGVWRRGDRRLAALPIVALAAVLVAWLLDVLGADYFNARNVMAALVPVLVFVAALIVTTRRAVAVTAAVAAGWLLLAGVIMSRDALQRPDLRALSAQLPDAGPRLLVVCDGADDQLIVYLGAERLAAEQATVAEIDVVQATAPAAPPPPPVSGFAPAGEHAVTGAHLTRYVAPGPRTVAAGRLRGSCAGAPTLLIQR